MSGWLFEGIKNHLLREATIGRLAGEFGVTNEEMRECMDSCDLLASASMAAMNVIPVDFESRRRLDR